MYIRRLTEDWARGSRQAGSKRCHRHCQSHRYPGRPCHASSLVTTLGNSMNDITTSQLRKLTGMLRNDSPSHVAETCEMGVCISRSVPLHLGLFHLFFPCLTSMRDGSRTRFLLLTSAEARLSSLSPFSSLTNRDSCQHLVDEGVLPPKLFCLFVCFESTILLL